MSSDSQSQTHLDELPPSNKATVHVDYWCSRVVQTYLSNPESRKWQVVQVERYKKRSRNQHEYMVASLEHPTHEHVNLRIERSRQHVEPDGKPILFDNQKLQESASPSSRGNERDLSSGQWVQWSSAVQSCRPTLPTPPPKPKGEFAVMSSISDSLNKSGNAYDYVKLHSPSPTSQDTRIEKLSLRNNPIPLVHLAILASTVHDKASLYNLFEAQCFWYADMIVRVIAKQQNQSDQLSEGPQEERCFSPRSGMFHMIPVHTARPAVVQEIENAFNERWNDFSEKETKALAEEYRILSQGNVIEDLRRVAAEKDSEMEAMRKRIEELEQSRQGGQSSNSI